VVDLVNRLRQAQQSAGEFDKVRANLTKLEAEVRDQPTNYQTALNLAATYIQMGHADRGYAVLDSIIERPDVNASAVHAVISAYMSMQQLPKLEAPLQKLCALLPNEPETWYDLAALRVSLGRPTEAFPALSNCLAANTARLARNPKSKDIAATLRADERFNGIRNLPEYQRLMP
jgi:thioredoxin-like negative regulator of GroEL